jgi:methylenetetrahydrofolate reductase (NADPH)
MRIAERLARSEPCFSFEFFPPKTDEGVASLMRTIAELKDLQPGFVSVTYGALGSSRLRTLEVATHIKAATGIDAMAHLSCVGHTTEELARILESVVSSDIENVLAVRGDGAPAAPSPESRNFQYASELVRFVRHEHPEICIGAAAYPEGHLECPDRARDLAHLKAKVDQGVDFLITQLFFDNAFYFDFVRRARQARIRVPIVPGIMPITNFEQIDRFTRLCGATLPMRLTLELEKRRNDSEAVQQLGIAHATLQCQELLSRGVPGIHFYTLNKSRATQMILAALRTGV